MPLLKDVFDRYYTTSVREIIDVLRASKDKPIDQIVFILPIGKRWSDVGFARKRLDLM